MKSFIKIYSDDKKLLDIAVAKNFTSIEDFNRYDKNHVLNSCTLRTRALWHYMTIYSYNGTSGLLHGEKKIVATIYRKKTNHKKIVLKK